MLNNELRQLLVIDQLCDVEQYEKCKTNGGSIASGVYPGVNNTIDIMPWFIISCINNRNVRQIHYHPYYSSITISSL